MYKKQNMKNFILILLAIFTMIGCKRIGDGEVGGTVTEKETGLPFPGVRVYIQRSKRSGENAKANETIIAEAITDEDGHYVLPVDLRLKYQYYIRCAGLSDEKNYTYTGYDHVKLRDKNGRIDFSLPPFAYVKIHLHKTSYINTTYANLFFNHNRNIGLKIPNHPVDTIYGVYRVTAFDSVIVEWEQIYNSLSDKGYKAFYINKGDTANYDINVN